MSLDPQGAASSFPQKPTSPGTGALGSTFTTQTYFEDFLYDIGSPGSMEIFNATNMSFGNPAGIDPAHPGVFYGDPTLGSPLYALNVLGNTQGFNLALFQTVNIEWVWQINQAPGGTRYQFQMGPCISNGCNMTQGDLTVMGCFPAGGCALMANQNLYLGSNDGADQVIDTGVTLASILGNWVKTNLIWDRATGFVRMLHNGVQVATTNTQIPVTLTDRRPIFEYNTISLGVINAGTRHLFDYVRVTYTMNR